MTTDDEKYSSMATFFQDKRCRFFRLAWYVCFFFLLVAMVLVVGILGKWAAVNMLLASAVGATVITVAVYWFLVKHTHPVPVAAIFVSTLFFCATTGIVCLVFTDVDVALLNSPWSAKAAPPKYEDLVMISSFTGAIFAAIVSWLIRKK